MQRLPGADISSDYILLIYEVDIGRKKTRGRWVTKKSRVVGKKQTGHKIVKMRQKVEGSMIYLLVETKQAISNLKDDMRLE